MAPMSGAARRIAVVVDGDPPPRWQARALQALAASETLRVVELRTLPKRRRGALARAHAAIERRLFALGPDALAAVGSAGWRPPPPDGDGEPELVVWLSERPPAEEPGLEVLHLRHAGRLEPAEEAFRRAALRGSSCVQTEVLLRRGTETLLLERTVSGARPFSTTLSRDRALWKIAAMVARAAERAPGPGVPAAPESRGATAPTTGELVLRSPARWARIVTARLRFTRPWRILVRERRADPLAGWEEAPLPVEWTPGHLYADPFLFEHEGRHHLFCEDLPPGAGRAVISHTELPGGGVPVPVLEAPYHLSYPCVFEHEDAIYMIPETSAQQRVELYSAVEFPGRWRREATLLDGVVASDATVLVEQDRLWLFVCLTEPHATMLDELHLFSADSPLGPWRAHPRNPVVSDVRCARPAGAIQRWGSQLVRPGQDGSRRYGGAISFRAIDVLDEHDYAEHEIARLQPGDLGARATHTYAADSRFEAVDLRRRERRRRLL
jgi:hypothetical protein